MIYSCLDYSLDLIDLFFMGHKIMTCAYHCFPATKVMFSDILFRLNQQSTTLKYSVHGHRRRKQAENVLAKAVFRNDEATVKLDATQHESI